VAAEVEQQAAALLGVAALAPGVWLGLGTPALEAALEAQHVAELAGLDQAAHGEEVAVEAAVLEHRHQPAAVARGLHQPAAVRRRGGQRLVHHHVQAGLECRQT